MTFARSIQTTSSAALLLLLSACADGEVTEDAIERVLQTDEAERLDAERAAETGPPGGVVGSLQGLWELTTAGLEKGDGLYWHFEGNRVSLLYPIDDRLVEDGSDVFRPVTDCADPQYDAAGRSVELGAGVFGPDHPVDVCWTIERIDADSLVFTVMQETLRLDRRDPSLLE